MALQKYMDGRVYIYIYIWRVGFFEIFFILFFFWAYFSFGHMDRDYNYYSFINSVLDFAVRVLVCLLCPDNNHSPRKSERRK